MQTKGMTKQLRLYLLALSNGIIMLAVTEWTDIQEELLAQEEKKTYPLFKSV